MAFAITKFKAYGVSVGSPIRKHAKQYAELHVSALTADTVLDINSYVGTFWGQALADGTYGALASSAKAALEKIQASVVGLIGVDSEQLMSKIKNIAPAAPTDYSLAVMSYLPQISLFAFSGATSWVIQLEWILKDGTPAVHADLGTNV